MADQSSTWESLKYDLMYRLPPPRARQPFSGNEFCTQCRKIDFDILFNGQRANWVISLNEEGTYDKIWRTPPQHVHYLLNEVSAMIENKECPMCKLISVIWHDEYPGEQPTDEQCFLMPVMSHHAYMGDTGRTVFVSETNKQLECVPTHVLIQFQPGYKQDLDLNGMTIGQYRPSHSHLTAWRLETHTGMLNILRSGLSRSSWVHDTIDWSTLRLWLQTCSEHHPECARPESHKCHPDMGYCVHDHSFGTSKMTSTPIKCIDVKTLTIRIREAHEEYVTLSWVWGDSKIDRSRIFHEDNVRLIPTQLPATIQDAITTTEQLGQRLLWVDAVCINQNDQEDLLKHINQMDLIYSQSTFTICAAVGRNGDAGLPGIKPNSRPHKHQQTVQARDHTIFATPGERLDFKTLLEHSPWRTRGWTFQEEFLSQRLLIFTEQEVLFRCKSGTGRETMMPLKKNLTALLHFHQSIFDTDYSDADSPGEGWSFGFYRGLVHKYLNRQLTYQKDTLNAFRGLENTIFNLQGVKFCSGLPETDLLNGLMWVHADHPDSVKRKGMFPSWSWAEWEGRPDYFHWEGRLMRHADGHYGVEVSTKGEAAQDVFLIGNSTVFPIDDGRETTSKLTIMGQTSKILIRRCRVTGEEDSPASQDTTTTTTGSAARKIGVACEVFNPQSNTYTSYLETKSIRQRHDTATALHASSNPGLEDYSPESDRNQLIPFILYLDPATGYDPFEVECVFLTGWVDQRYEGTISQASNLGDGWHHVVVLVFERLQQTDIQRIGLLYLDVRVWMAAERTVESLTLV